MSNASPYSSYMRLVSQLPSWFFFPTNCISAESSCGFFKSSTTEALLCKLMNWFMKQISVMKELNKNIFLVRLLFILECNTFNYLMVLLKVECFHKNSGLKFILQRCIIKLQMTHILSQGDWFLGQVFCGDFKWAYFLE